MGNFASDYIKKILDLAHAAITIINLYVTHESHDFYKPIACLIIKISMIEIRIRFPNGFYNTAVYLEKWVW